MRRSTLVHLALSALICPLFVSTVQATPVANLPLTCPSASAIGQAQDTCSGLAYQLPLTEDLVVLQAPDYAPTWNRAASLSGSQLLAVCALPVEPGTYSSCRDASGQRRIAYVPKSQVFTMPGPTGLVLAQVTFSNVRSIRTGELAHYTGSDQWIGFDVVTSQVVATATRQVLSFGPSAFFAVRDSAFTADDPSRSTRYCLDMIRSLALSPTPGTQLTLFLNVTQESLGGPNFVVHTFNSCNLELVNP